MSGVCRPYSRRGRDALSRPQSAFWEGPATSSSHAGLAAGTDAREREDVVGGRREDRIPVEVLLRREAVKVLRAVRGPARPHEQRDDRLNLQEDVGHLREQLLLLRRVEGRLPLVEEGGCLRVVDMRPVAGVRGVLARGRELQLRQVAEEEAVWRCLRGRLPEQGR